jgi:hypothetical protein
MKLFSESLLNLLNFERKLKKQLEISVKMMFYRRNDEPVSRETMTELRYNYYSGGGMFSGEIECFHTTLRKMLFA